MLKLFKLLHKGTHVDDKFNYIRTKMNHLYGAFRALLDLQKSIEEQAKTINELLKPKE